MTAGTLGAEQITVDGERSGHYRGAVPVYRDYLEQRGARTIRGWSEIMGHKFGQDARDAIDEYYRAKGAAFE